MSDYIPHDDKRRAKNLNEFHGKTPKEIKNARWYHGTVQDFTHFKPGRAEAIFLSKNPNFANEFASQGAIEQDWDEKNKIFIPRDGSNIKPNMMPVHVRAENPFDYQNKKHINALIERLGPQLINDPFLMDMIPQIRRGSWDAIESIPVQKAIKSMGHDSFFVNETGEKNLAVYDPSQIKSATGNRGTFDQSSPDITKAEGGAVDLSQYQDKTNFGLYSHAAETAAALPQAKGTPEQLKAMLMKQGVKPAEIEHSNYDDVFGNRPSVTKDEVAQHFRQSMPTIKEHVSGGARRAYPQEYYDIETQIGDRYRSRLQALQQEANDFSLRSADRAAAQETYENLVDQMHREIDRAIPNREEYLQPTKTKFEQYSMPGGENYREVRLQLERGEDNYERMAGEVYRQKTDLVNQYANLEPGDPRGPEISAQIREATQKYNQLLDKSNASQRKKFVAGHWDEPDVLAHLRMKDRTGPNGEKILHVDEIQSDWGQHGRSNGFEDPKAEERYNMHVERMRDRLREETRKTFEEATKGQDITPEHKERILAPILNGVEKMHPMTVATTLKMEDEHKKEVDKLNSSSSGIPHGPYVTNTAAWTDLALKRVLHEAASGGYDKVIFTKGEDQADRYDLSKHIGSIEAYPRADGTVHLRASDTYGEEWVHDDVHEPKELPNIVGKELADKIMQRIKFPKDREGYRIRNKKSGYTGDTTNTLEAAQQSLALFPANLQPDLEILPYKWREAGRGTEIGGLDLKVGGEGMKAFYDRLVPKQLMEITKRHDPEVKIKPDTIVTPEGPTDVHAIDITPKLRESILRGQRAFADGGAVENEGITAYHGSPHDFDRFDLSKIGTGEGAQAYGHGLYFAGAEPVAQTYRGDPEERYRRFSGHMDPKEEYAFDLASHAGDVRDFDVMMGLAKKYGENISFEEAEKLARKAVSKRGHMYEVHIAAHPDHFLDWDKPLKEQHPVVIEAIQSLPYGREKFLENARNIFWGLEDARSAWLQRTGADTKGNQEHRLHVSNDLKNAGLPGIKYFDQGSRGAGEGSRNYVVFDDKLVTTKRKYARGGSVAA